MRFSGKKTERLTIKIEPDLKALFDQLATHEKTTVSEYLRTLIVEELRRKEQK